MKKLLALAACLLMAFPLWGCSSQGGNNSSGGVQYTQGETATVGVTKTTLNEVKESHGQGSYSPAAGNVFLLCEVTVENTSDEEMNISSMMSFACTVDGEETDVSIPAMASRGDKQQMDGSIPTGESMTGVLGYEVPEDWKEISIRFKPSLTAYDQAVFYAEK